MKQLLIIFSLLGVLFSCKKENPSKIDIQGKRYYPLEIGHWIEFEVDSITLNDFYSPPKIDTSSSFMKLEVADSFRDNTGQLAFKMTFSWRSSDTMPWKVNNVFTVTDEGNSLHAVEQNLRLIKLVFPISQSAYWFGDSFFHPTQENDFMGADTFRYDQMHVPMQINGLSFDSVVSVVSSNENLIEKNDYIERYVAGIGLVYSKKLHLEKQNISGDWENGFDIEYRVIDYKKD